MSVESEGCPDRALQHGVDPDPLGLTQDLTAKQKVLSNGDDELPSLGRGSLSGPADGATISNAPDSDPSAILSSCSKLLSSWLGSASSQSIKYREASADRQISKNRNSFSLPADILPFSCIISQCEESSASLQSIRTLCSHTGSICRAKGNFQPLPHRQPSAIAIEDTSGGEMLSNALLSVYSPPVTVIEAKHGWGSTTVLAAMVKCLAERPDPLLSGFPVVCSACKSVDDMLIQLSARLHSDLQLAENQILESLKLCYRLRKLVFFMDLDAFNPEFASECVNLGFRVLFVARMHTQAHSPHQAALKLTPSAVVMKLCGVTCIRQPFSSKNISLLHDTKSAGGFEPTPVGEAVRPWLGTPLCTQENLEQWPLLHNCLKKHSGKLSPVADMLGSDFLPHHCREFWISVAMDALQSAGSPSLLSSGIFRDLHADSPKADEFEEGSISLLFEGLGRACLDWLCNPSLCVDGSVALSFIHKSLARLPETRNPSTLSKKLWQAALDSDLFVRLPASDTSFEKPQSAAMAAVLASVAVVSHVKQVQETKSVFTQQGTLFKSIFRGWWYSCARSRFCFLMTFSGLPEQYRRSFLSGIASSDFPWFPQAAVLITFYKTILAEFNITRRHTDSELPANGSATPTSAALSWISSALSNSHLLTEKPTVSVLQRASSACFENGSKSVWATPLELLCSPSPFLRQAAISGFSLLCGDSLIVDGSLMAIISNIDQPAWRRVAAVQAVQSLQDIDDATVACLCQPVLRPSGNCTQAVRVSCMLAIKVLLGRSIQSLSQQSAESSSHWKATALKVVCQGVADVNKEIANVAIACAKQNIKSILCWVSSGVSNHGANFPSQNELIPSWNLKESERANIAAILPMLDCASMSTDEALAGLLNCGSKTAVMTSSKVLGDIGCSSIAVQALVNRFLQLQEPSSLNTSLSLSASGCISEALCVLLQRLPAANIDALVALAINGPDAEYEEQIGDSSTNSTEPCSVDNIREAIQSGKESEIAKTMPRVVVLKQGERPRDSFIGLDGRKVLFLQPEAVWKTRTVAVRVCGSFLVGCSSRNSSNIMVFPADPSANQHPAPGHQSKSFYPSWKSKFFKFIAEQLSSATDTHCLSKSGLVSYSQHGILGEPDNFFWELWRLGIVLGYFADDAEIACRPAVQCWQHLLRVSEASFRDESTCSPNRTDKSDAHNSGNLELVSQRSDQKVSGTQSSQTTELFLPKEMTLAFKQKTEGLQLKQAGLQLLRRCCGALSLALESLENIASQDLSREKMAGKQLPWSEAIWVLSEFTTPMLTQLCHQFAPVLSLALTASDGEWPIKCMQQLITCMSSPFVRPHSSYCHFLSYIAAGASVPTLSTSHTSSVGISLSGTERSDHNSNTEDDASCLLDSNDGLFGFQLHQDIALGLCSKDRIANAVRESCCRLLFRCTQASSVTNNQGYSESFSTFSEMLHSAWNYLHSCAISKSEGSKSGTERCQWLHALGSSAASACAYGWHGSEQVLDVVVHAFMDVSNAVRAAASDAAVSLGVVEGAAETLHPYLTSSSADIRKRALLALPLLSAGSGGVAGAVSRAMLDDDSSVRVAAIRVASTSGAAEGLVQQLIKLLDDDDASVRLEAARSVTAFTLKFTAATDVLLESASDPRPRLRVEAISALGKLGGGSAGWARVIQCIANALTDESTDVQEAAIGAVCADGMHVQSAHAVLPVLPIMHSGSLLEQHIAAHVVGSFLQSHCGMSEFLSTGIFQASPCNSARDSVLRGSQMSIDAAKIVPSIVIQSMRDAAVKLSSNPKTLASAAGLLHWWTHVNGLAQNGDLDHDALAGQMHGIDWVDPSLK